MATTGPFATEFQESSTSQASQVLLTQAPMTQEDPSSQDSEPLDQVMDGNLLDLWLGSEKLDHRSYRSVIIDDLAPWVKSIVESSVKRYSALSKSIITKLASLDKLKKSQSSSPHDLLKISLSDQLMKDDSLKESLLAIVASLHDALRDSVVELKSEKLNILHDQCQIGNFLALARGEMHSHLSKIGWEQKSEELQGSLAMEVQKALEFLEKKLIHITLESNQTTDKVKLCSADSKKLLHEFQSKLTKSIFIDREKSNQKEGDLPKGERKKAQEFQEVFIKGEKDWPSKAKGKIEKSAEGGFEKEEVIDGCFVLTRIKIPSDILLILQKGIKYIPYSYFNPSQALSDYDNMVSNIISQMKQKEVVIPEIFSLYRKKYRIDLMNAFSKSKQFALSLLEENTLKMFLKNNQLALKPADKNLGWVVMDIEWYKKEVFKHLNDTITYQKQELKEAHILAILRLRFSLLSKKLRLPVVLKNKLRPSLNCRLPYFYILPKVHKIPVSSRPVVPNVDSSTTATSKWLSLQLQPVLKLFPWILQGTKEMVCYLETTCFSIVDPILMSADVSSMYTNIPTEAAHKHFLNFRTQYLFVSRKENLPKFPYSKTKWNEICELLLFVLQNNYFIFQENIYSQIKGTAMGTNCAPDFAQIFLGIFEWRHVFIKKLKLPDGYKRYVDDTFMIIPSIQLEETKKVMRNLCSNFSWTFEVGKSLPFLDLLISLGSKFKRFQKLDFCTYEKPINSHLYTSPSQNYPFKYKFNWIQGETVRMLRNSSNKNVFIKHILKFKRLLLKRKYPKDIIDSQINSVKWDSRLKYLSQLEVPPFTKRTVVVPFHPQWKVLLPNIQQLLLDSQIDNISMILCKGRSLQNTASSALKHMLD